MNNSYVLVSPKGFRIIASVVVSLYIIKYAYFHLNSVVYFLQLVH